MKILRMTVACFALALPITAPAIPITVEGAIYEIGQSSYNGSNYSTSGVFDTLWYLDDDLAFKFASAYYDVIRDRSDPGQTFQHRFFTSVAFTDTGGGMGTYDWVYRHNLVTLAPFYFDKRAHIARPRPFVSHTAGEVEFMTAELLGNADVPEPSVNALFAAGLFGIGFARRRKA